MVMIGYLLFWSFLGLGVGLREREGEEEVLCLRRRLWEGERRLEVLEWRWETGDGEYLLLRELEGERDTLRLRLRLRPINLNSQASLTPIIAINQSKTLFTTQSPPPSPIPTNSPLYALHHQPRPSLSLYI